jgi:hypothetical protein
MGYRWNWTRCVAMHADGPLAAGILHLRHLFIAGKSIESSGGSQRIPVADETTAGSSSVSELEWADAESIVTSKLSSTPLESASEDMLISESITKSLSECMAGKRGAKGASEGVGGKRETSRAPPHTRSCVFQPMAIDVCRWLTGRDRARTSANGNDSTKSPSCRRCRTGAAVGLECDAFRLTLKASARGKVDARGEPKMQRDMLTRNA